MGADAKQNASSEGSFALLSYDENDKNTLNDLMEELNTSLSNACDDAEVKDAFDKISMQICVHPDLQEQAFDAIMNANTPQVIVKTLEKWIDTEFVVAQALSAIHNSSLAEEIAQEYVKLGAFGLVVKCMKMYPDNIHLQTRGCGALGMMVKMNQPAIMVPLIRENDAASAYVQAMENHYSDAKLIRWALKGLDILTEIVDLREYYLDAGVLGTVAMFYDRFRKGNDYAQDISRFAWSIILQLKPIEE